jgi:HSP20 family protein
MATQEIKKQSELLPKLADNLFTFDDFENYFDDFVSRRWPRLMDWHVPVLSQGTYPSVDIIDHENSIEVHAALPGIKKEEVDVSIKNQTITIRTTTKSEKKEHEKGKYFRREITRGEYQRILALPDNVDDEKATATFKEGILTVSIPKTEKSKRKTIEIK